MTQLMESTLVAARLEAGRPTIQIGACDIRSIVREICNRQQDIAQKHIITCNVKELPDIIQADSGAVEQIFTNLLSNAVKYAAKAPDIQVTAELDGTEHITVRVRDYGIGIDEEDLPNMFQRFFRARTSTGIAGTGIGLNLVKTLVELHNGSIKVESAKGEGSLFTVRLPIEGPVAASETEGQAA
jgi:signal transduction histidine kinase